jgi:hypothetical protein
MGETCAAELFVFEMPARRGEERIHGGFVHHRVFLITFALDGPKSPEVVRATRSMPVSLPPKSRRAKKIVPKPDVGKEVGIARVGLQVGLHEAFEFIALVAFGNRVLSEGV